LSGAASKIDSVSEEKALDQGAQTKQADEKQKAVGDLNKKTGGKLSMNVHIYSPNTDYYDGLAFSLSATSATGEFDILPKHHNFISLLKACEVVIRTTDQGEKRIRISGGLIHIKADQAIIFLDV
jgi:hypothetical protein